MNRQILFLVGSDKTAGWMTSLLQMKGYRAMGISNGLDALRKVQAEKPDLLIIDTFLPGLDGFEVCHRLRLAKETAKIPVIMISSRPHSNDRQTARNVGASAYLAKPFKTSELLNTVTSLLADKKDLEQAEVKVPRMEDELMKDTLMERSRKPRKRKMRPDYPS